MPSRPASTSKAKAKGSSLPKGIGLGTRLQLAGNTSNVPSGQAAIELARCLTGLAGGGAEAQAQQQGLAQQLWGAWCGSCDPELRRDLTAVLFHMRHLLAQPLVQLGAQEGLLEAAKVSGPQDGHDIVRDVIGVISHTIVHGVVALLQHWCCGATCALTSPLLPPAALLAMPARALDHTKKRWHQPLLHAQWQPLQELLGAMLLGAPQELVRLRAHDVLVQALMTEYDMQKWVTPETAAALR